MSNDFHPHRTHSQPLLPRTTPSPSPVMSVLEPDPPKHPSFHPKLNRIYYLYFIVLSKAIRIITFHKPCENFSTTPLPLILLKTNHLPQKSRQTSISFSTTRIVPKPLNFALTASRSARDSTPFFHQSPASSAISQLLANPVSPRRLHKKSAPRRLDQCPFAAAPQFHSFSRFAQRSAPSHPAASPCQACKWIRAAA